MKKRFRLAHSTTLLWFAAAVVVGAAACSESPATTSPPSTCSPELSKCGESCVDPQTDPENCGSCGKACATGERCVAGACAAAPGCPDGQDDCGGTCVNTQTDAAHCGGCSTACADGETCVAGKCEGGGCADGETDCGGSCVDLAADEGHCGACDVACADGEACVAGECKPDCMGQTDCDGVCVDLQTDAQHCGACETACDAGQACEAGACVGPTCPTGQTDCGGGACFDLTTDAQHCGDCSRACNPLQGCQAGSCVCSVGPGTGLGSAVPQTVTGTTAGAPGAFAPSCTGASAGERVYSFTAPSAGVYVFDTAGSSFNTVVAVVDAAGCAELSCNANTGGTARVSVDLATGQTVYAIVDGAGTAAGNYSLSITRALASGCPAGTLGSTVPQVVTGSTAGRPNSVVPACNAVASPDAGYAFTAPAAGDYVFDTYGSSFDTVLHIHNGTCAGATLGCNDDTLVEQSEVTVTLAAGQTVVAVVDGFNGAFGAFQLRVDTAPPPPQCDNTGVCGNSTSGCVECALNHDCRDERDTCTSTPDCVDYVNCVVTCTTPACTNGCAVTHPSGAGVYNTLLACLYCDECPNDCRSVGFMCP